MIYEFLQNGGPWMLPIVGVSVVGLAFILERAWFWASLWLRRDAGMRRRILLGELPAVSTRSSDPRAQVLLELARSVDAPEDAVERARALVRASRDHLRMLTLASSLGWSLGLFGTVLALSSANARPTPAALNAVILGLVVYVATHVAHTVFSGLSAGLGRDLEEELNAARRALLVRRQAVPA